MSKSLIIKCSNCKEEYYLIDGEMEDYYALIGINIPVSEEGYYMLCFKCKNEVYIPSREQLENTNHFSTLAQEINKEHEMAYSEARSSFAHALRAGELLCKAKASLKHGLFQNWIKDNCSFEVRMAENYMKLFMKREVLEKAQSVALLKGGEYTITRALRMIELEEGMSILKEHEAIDRERKSKEKYREFDHAVQEYLVKANSFRGGIKIGEEAFEIGKFTPEAMKFTINRNKLIIRSLREFNKLLGDDEE